MIQLNKRQGPLGFWCTLFTSLVIIVFAAFPALADQKEANAPKFVSPDVFVQKNIKAARAKLETLKKGYSSECGSVLAALSPVDVATIADRLPKPKELSYVLEYPEPNWKSLIKPVTDKSLLSAGQVLANNLSVSAMRYNGSWGFGSRRTNERWPMQVASDELTASLLSLPYKIGLSVNASLYYPGQPQSDSGCCSHEASRTETYTTWYGKKKTQVVHYCGGHQTAVYMKSAWGDPRSVPAITEKLGISGGAKFIENKAGMVVSSPGRKTISITLPAYKWPESMASSRPCVAKYSYKDKVPVSYRAAGTVNGKIYLSAVKFEKIGFPGDPGFQATPDDLPAYDFFFEGYAPFGWFSGGIDWDYGYLIPKLLVSADDGSGLSKKVVEAWRYNAAIRVTTLSAGPITVSSNGRLGYINGSGQTKAMWQLGDTAEVRKTLTANRVNVKLDPRLEDGIASAGATYTVRLEIDGPADMAGYTAKWAGDVDWTSADTTFTKKGEKTISENTFVMPDTKWRTKTANGTKKSSSKKFRITAEIMSAKTTRSMLIYETELAGGPPAISRVSLSLFRGKDKKAVSGPGDLFVPNIKPDSSALIIEPVINLQNTKDDFNAAETGRWLKYEINAADPGVVRLKRADKDISPSAFIVYPARSDSGSTDVTVRIGGSDLDPKGRIETMEGGTVVSDPIKVTVNLMMLTREKAGGEKETYRLRIMGPAVMSKYRAEWVRKGSASKTNFTNDHNFGWVAAYTTGLGVSAVRIIEGDTLVAELDVTKGTCVPEATIRLAPVQAPITAIQTQPLPDVGMAGTVTECKKQIKEMAESKGIAFTGSIKDYCKEKRLKEKADILKQREWLKSQNKKVKELARQGLEVVILKDTMSVGAAIRGLSRQYWNAAVCQWSISGDFGLKLESDTTPAHMLSEDAGGCFNTVSGIREHFDPDAVVEVMLFIKPQQIGKPVFSDNDSVVVSTGKDTF